MEPSSSDLMALIKVFSTVAASMTYARFAASLHRPGFPRLISVLPVLLLLLSLPFFFNSIHLRFVSALSLAWLSTFKLLLLSLDMGPLSPSLPLLTFVAISSLPIKLRPLGTISSSSSKAAVKQHLQSLLIFVTKALIWALIITSFGYSNLQIHQAILIPYLALDLMFGILATLAGGLLRLNLEPQFNAPLKSTSLEEFWGRRWNLMMTDILRSAVYNPTKTRLGETVGVLATFLVSGLMHEVLLYYSVTEVSTGELTLFFVVHGVCVALEKKGRRRGWWRPHPAVGRAVTGGVMGVTIVWLAFPPVKRSGMGRICLEESSAIVIRIFGGYVD